MSEQATYVEGLIGHLEPFENRPHAQKVLKTESAHVVVFEFGAGHHLRDHAAAHPVVIQVVRGHARFTYTENGDEHTVDLRPGDLIHLTAMLRHEVLAVEPTTLTVTMLLA
ncbi:MAG: hypothetical protein V9G04_16515 [Nocardioides sp.]|jgi:quercetin dioxygenase-like cupin family protein